MGRTKTTAMRCALRVEGNWWVAYAAQLGTMDGAVEMARIAMIFVQDRRRKKAFMALMQSAMGDLIADLTGGQVDGWNDPVLAPEHEKSGRA